MGSSIQKTRADAIVDPRVGDAGVREQVAEPDALPRPGDAPALDARDGERRRVLRHRAYVVERAFTREPLALALLALPALAAPTLWAQSQGAAPGALKGRV